MTVSIEKKDVIAYLSDLNADELTELLEEVNVPADSDNNLDPSVPFEGLDKINDVVEFDMLEAHFHSIAPVNPFFMEREGIDADRSVINGREIINFTSNNFLSLAGDNDVISAAENALRKYGSSVSGSRIVSGERPIHRQLESCIAEWVGTKDAIALVSSNFANLTTIGHLFNEKDLIVCDEFSHDSLLQGAKLSGAKTILFKHNDYLGLDEILTEHRNKVEKVLIYIEGLYSMDGDIPDLPEFIHIKKKHSAILMVDECLSIGILGKTGRGIGELFDIDREDVDIWMGGISKAFASCGGYIAGSAGFINYLRYTSPGMVYTTGLPASSAASAITAMNILDSRPELLKTLHELTTFFWSQLIDAGFDVGSSSGEGPIVPIIIGDLSRCMQLHGMLFEEGINTTPIIYPAVPLDASRLRFSICVSHSFEDLEKTINILKVCFSNI